ncbi:MAG TPA: thioredoxin domain-containing protein [Pyrinomonadaceae bacterium]
MSSRKPSGSTKKPTGSKTSSSKTSGSKSYLPFIIIGGVLLAAIGAGAMLYRSSGTDAPSSAGSTSTTSSPSSQATLPPQRVSPANAPVGAQPPHVRGDVGAPVTIEEFADFQCPSCARLHAELKKIEGEYGSKLRVIFRNFPLPSMHEHAIDAARAAEAAGRQKRFWEMHDMLYEKQDIWKNDPDVQATYTGYARTLGLNPEQFKADMNAPAIIERVLADQTRGRSLGVTGTPTLFLNGREVDPKTMSADGLRAQIDAALAGTKK